MCELPGLHVTGDFPLPSTSVPPWPFVYETAEDQRSNIFSKDNPQEFNVVSLLDFDTRGHILRYPLEYILNLNPMGVEEYKYAQSLYVLSEKSYDFRKATVWEINIFEAEKIIKLEDIDEKYAVFKLTK